MVWQASASSIGNKLCISDGGRQDERLMPEVRCRQAIAYLEKRDTERYVWFVGTTIIILTLNKP